jgi:hypothetical protein
LRRRLGLSTTSLTYVVDGLSTFPPFEIEIVDCRDNLIYEILHSEEDLTVRERIKKSGNLLFSLSPLLIHILSLVTDGAKWLIGFGPGGIVKNCEKNYVIVYSISLILRENGRETFKPELGRWKAPEILSKQEENETEKSLVFTLGMSVYSIIYEERTFDEDNDEVAMGKIVMGDRPDLHELEERKSGMVDVMRDCYWQEPSERIGLVELRDRVGGVNYGEELDDDEYGEGEGEYEKEEDKKKEEEKPKGQGDGAVQNPPEGPVPDKVPPPPQQQPQPQPHGQLPGQAEGGGEAELPLWPFDDDPPLIAF